VTLRLGCNLSHLRFLWYTGLSSMLKISEFFFLIASVEKEEEVIITDDDNDEEEVCQKMI
jgi:hypothetical protein